MQASNADVATGLAACYGVTPREGDGMFGFRRLRMAQTETLRRLNRIQEIVMASQAQIADLQSAVQQLGTSVSGVASRFQALADKIDAAAPDDSGEITSLTAQIRQEATSLDALGQSAATATVESPPTVTTAEPAPEVDTTTTGE